MSLFSNRETGTRILKEFNALAEKELFQKDSMGRLYRLLPLDVS
jgi:hypothetical protein